MPNVWWTATWMFFSCVVALVFFVAFSLMGRGTRPTIGVRRHAARTGRSEAFWSAGQAPMRVFQAEGDVIARPTLLPSHATAPKSTKSSLRGETSVSCSSDSVFLPTSGHRTGP